jgi:hypothetical protein
MKSEKAEKIFLQNRMDPKPAVHDISYREHGFTKLTLLTERTQTRVLPVTSWVVFFPVHRRR